MRWFEEQRLKWIGERLASHGFINRGDVMNKFGVSIAQASKDLNKFIQNYPDLMLYNLKTKRYEFNSKKF